MKITINLTTLILLALIIGGFSFFGFKYYNNKIDSLKSKLENEVKLKDALIDDVSYYKNKENEWVAEKLTIQESIKNIEKISDKLNKNQKDLINRIAEINKKNDLIAAALIETDLKIDSLLIKSDAVVDTVNKKITFADTYKQGLKEMTYSFTVKNVLPSSLSNRPMLFIDSLIFPNKQFIEFHWKNDKKKGYPISFSVSNSNDFFKTVNVESYVIPEISKEIINPNGWQKIQNYFIRNGDKVVYFGVGGLVGALAYGYLVK